MYDIPVIDPYSGYLHLTMAQRDQFEREGYIKFYEQIPFEALPISRFDKNTDVADIKIVTFEKLRAGKGYVAKVITGNPHRLPTWKGATHE